MMVKGKWRMLATIEPPHFNTEGVSIFHRDHWRMIETIRSGLALIPAISWEKSYGWLRDFFGLDNERQCFSEAQMEWTSFHEPQITRGLVHFLDAAPTSARSERCIAFARAVSASCKAEHRQCFSKNPLNVRVVAEEQRIDILIELTDEQGRFGVAVEAKFKHRLTKGQLESAVNHATRRGWDLDRSCFLVIGPHLARLDYEILNQNSKWSSVTWWGLLRYLESELSNYADSAEFRRFRSPIWSQSYVRN